MDNYQYFHLCDHRIRKGMDEREEMNLDVTNMGTQTDIAINGAVILRVKDIKVLEYDPEDYEIKDFFYDDREEEPQYDDERPGHYHYDEIDLYVVDYSRYFISPQEPISERLPPGFYEPILHNRIRWLVKPPKRYRVLAEVRFTAERVTVHDPPECPICRGKGWFVDILGKNGNFHLSEGPYRIAQRVVKDLLTELGSHPFDETYGTSLKEDALRQLYTDDDLFDLIQMSISDVEEGYKNAQDDKMGVLSDSEILNALIVEGIYRSDRHRSIVVIRLRIVTNATDDVLQLGI